jgi:signal transduction histidine kinase
VVADFTKILRDETVRKLFEERLRSLNEALEERVNERTREMATYQHQLRSLVAELTRTEQRERQRVATELHDNLAQLLAVCKMKASAIEASAQTGSTVAEEAAAVKDFLGDGIAYTRTLMADLRPDLLNDSDLAGALAWVAQRMKRHGLEVRVADDGLPKPLNEVTEETARRLDQVRRALGAWFVQFKSALRCGSSDSSQCRTLERMSSTLHEPFRK